jgi:copper chaperone CopZ
MKNSFKNIMVAAFVLLSITSIAQIKNSKTESVKIFGNCGMCETKIEKSGTIKKVAKVDWNQETQMATLTYDAVKTNQDEILKRIALAGYDSEKFFAPDDVYNNLNGCCQYERVAKALIKEETKTEETKTEEITEIPKAENQEVNQLKAVFDTYFVVKDAMISSDGNATSIASKELLISINNIKMEKLEMDVHMVWMKVFNEIKNDSEQISNIKDIKKQRNHFVTLSKDIYALLKVAKYDVPVYFQNCPMYNDGKGANWLSKENAVKNPYYGSMMLTCGKTIETIK